MLKRILKFLLGTLIVLLLLSAIGFYSMLSSTGYFRKLEPVGLDKIQSTIELYGVEDITISYTDSFAVLSATDRAAERQGRTPSGDLYYLDLKTPNVEPINLTSDLPFEFFPHGISYLQVDSIHYLAAISHSDRGHSVEVFKIQGPALQHVKTYQDDLLAHPNDLVLVDKDKFYYSNDQGAKTTIRKLLESFGGFGLASIGYFDGTSWRLVAEKLAYANGVNVDPDRKLAFVAASRSFELNVYDIADNGDLNPIETIDCKTGVDNIEIAPDGTLWIGCHPSLLHFFTYAGGKSPTAPSEIITIDYRGKGDYAQSLLFLDDGQYIDGSSVAAPFGDQYLIGTVADSIVAIVNQ